MALFCCLLGTPFVLGVHEELFVEVRDIRNIHKRIAVRTAPMIIGESAEALRDWNQEEGVGVFRFSDAKAWARAGNSWIATPNQL